VATWSLAWLAGAWSITEFRAAIPGAATLLTGAAIFAIAFMMLCWTKPAAPVAQGQSRGTGFASFWVNSTGAARIAFFILAYACLFFVSRVAIDEKWVGMASALPLPGFFALAALIEDAERSQDSRSGAKLLPIRDTLFLGPVLVIPFNWAFAHALVSALPDATFARYLLLLALWTLAALAVLIGVPRLERYFDGRAP
jgi:hypothetical protein